MFIELLNKLFIIFYIIPLFITVLYFTVLKLMDSFTEDKSFTPDKLTYSQSLMVSFIPVLNLIMATYIVSYIIF